MGRKDEITAYVKRYDRELYCDEGMEGKLCIYRKSRRWYSYQLADGVVIQDLRPAPFFICALTDTWRMDGRPVDRGCLPIYEHLQRIDLWKHDVAGELEEQQAKHDQKQERHLKNETEAFLKDFRTGFAKATNEINTGNMSKADPRKKMEKSKWAL